MCRQDSLFVSKDRCMLAPKVSVIIPYYNREHTIALALQSVLAQTLVDWEVVLVDDASRVDPGEIVSRIVPAERLQVIRQPTNQGPGAARNAGVRAARGEYVAFLDSDDAWMPEKLEHQLRAVLALPEPEMAFCVTQTRVEMGDGAIRIQPSRPVGQGESFADFLYVGMEFAQSSSFFLSRAAALKLPFEEELRQYEDHLFFIDAGNFGMRYSLVPQQLVVWYDDDREDRLGSADSVRRGYKFLDLARRRLGERAAAGFEARFLGPYLLRSSPLQALGALARAVSRGAMTPVAALKVIVRALVPASMYRAARLAKYRAGR